MTNFNERTNTPLYKNMYPSHFILDVSVVCERCVETGTDCYTDPISSPDHSFTSSASWLELLNRGTLRATVISLQAGPHSGFPDSNSTAASTCLYSFITATCFRFFFHIFTRVHLLIDGSVKGQYIIVTKQSKGGK